MCVLSNYTTAIMGKGEFLYRRNKEEKSSRPRRNEKEESSTSDVPSFE